MPSNGFSDPSLERDSPVDSATQPAAQTGLGWARQAQGPYSPLVDPSQACFSSFSVKQPHEQPPSPFKVASRSRSGKSPLLGLSITSYSFHGPVHLSFPHPSAAFLWAQEGLAGFLGLSFP